MQQSEASERRQGGMLRVENVSERVRPFVAEVGRVRQLTRPDGVQDDDARPRHAAILRAVATVLGLIGMVVFIAGVISLAAAVTYTVVKLTPTGSRKRDTATEGPDSSA